MKIGMTIWGNRISPVFDSAQTILLATVKNGEIVSEAKEFIPGNIPTNLAKMLVAKEIDTLICGAISEQPARIIESAGITLVSFVAGNAEKLLHAYAHGGSVERFLMPGCGSNCREKDRTKQQPQSTQSPDSLVRLISKQRSVGKSR